MDHEIELRTLCDVLDEAEPIAKLNARHPNYDSSQLHDALKGVLDSTTVITISDPTFIEITSTGVTKASALTWLCEELGIDRSEVIAFGDMTNDIPMLSWAGYAVAMGNAHADLMQIADEVAPPCSEDGVAVVLERTFGNRGSLDDDIAP